MSVKPDPKDIVEELLRLYSDALSLTVELSKHENVEPPEATTAFELIFDLMGIPPREQLHRLRIPNPRKPEEYVTRDSLVQEFFHIYDDPNVRDDEFVKLYMTFLESLTPKDTDKLAHTLPPALAN